MHPSVFIVMTFEKVQSILQLHTPALAINYCLELWYFYKFDFKLRKSRLTKIGDFTFRTGKAPRITVNQDLHPFMFLTTYIHEVAHLETHKKFGARVESHGSEWKNCFKELLNPVLTKEVFPDELLEGLRAHMADPMATTFSDPALMRIFRKYDERALAVTLLSDIPVGSVFSLRGRWFTKGHARRTRVLCQEIKSKKKYLVPIDAPVENVQLSLL
jgi:SprT protein